ncbi:MAG: hypothetical protein ABIM88_02320 [candidate division WOR-3 bacterium]
MLKRIGFLVILGFIIVSCDERGLAGSPQIKLKVEEGGAAVAISWYNVVGAERYQLWVDGVKVYEGTDTSYYLANPARKIRTVAIGGTESTMDEVDLSAVTDTVEEVYERDGEGVCAIGFTGDGKFVLYALSDTSHDEDFTLYMDDFRPDTTNPDSVRMVSSNFNAFGDPFNKKRTWFAFWGPDSLLAPDTASYQQRYSPVLKPDSVYALWLDPDTNGWDAGHNYDYFLKVRIISGPDSAGKISFQYWFQRIGGLRWIPEPAKQE